MDFVSVLTPLVCINRASTYKTDACPLVLDVSSEIGRVKEESAVKDIYVLVYTSRSVLSFRSLHAQPCD